MPGIKNFLSVFLLILIMSNGYAEQKSRYFAPGKIVFMKQDLAIDVEVATTKKQRTIGLMFREYLAPNTGMLFVFENEIKQRVWMKYTLISLDIVFMNAQGKIVSMIKNLQPCQTELCEIYDSTVPAKYMLEVNAGLLKRQKIKVGQKLLFYY